MTLFIKYSGFGLMLHFPLYSPEELRTKKLSWKYDNYRCAIIHYFFVRFGTLCLCVLLADNQELIAVKKLCLYSSTIHYVYTVVLYIMFIQWYCTLCLYSGTVHYVYTVVLNIMFIQWYCTLCLYSGTVHYVYTVVLNIMFIQWY